MDDERDEPYELTAEDDGTSSRTSTISRRCARSSPARA